MRLRRDIGIEIVSTGMYVPEKILTNQDLEKMVDTSDKWITERTGIKRRHILDDPNLGTSFLAFKASQMALERANLNPEEIDVIILGTASPDHLFPATGCIVQDMLGAKNAFAYDIEAGCTSFIYALSIATGYIYSGIANTALVVGAEALSRFTDWTDRNTCVLFGDGAGAFLLRATEDTTKGPITFDLGSDGTAHDLITLPAGGTKLPASHETVDNRLHYIKMKGREVFKLAVLTIERSMKKMLNDAGLKPEDVDLLILHQANVRIIDFAVQRFGFDKSRTYINIHEYGNTSSASIPIAFHEAVEEGKIEPGAKVMLLAFGAGFTWGGVIWQV